MIADLVFYNPMNSIYSHPKEMAEKKFEYTAIKAMNCGFVFNSDSESDAIAFAKRNGAHALSAKRGTKETVLFGRM